MSQIFEVTVSRTERIVYRVEADDVEMARERYLGDGDELSSETVATVEESIEDVSTYRVERRYAESHAPEVLATGQSLEEAQEHCNDPETSSRSCTSAEGLARTADKGAWFDMYYLED